MRPASGIGYHGVSIVVGIVATVIMLLTNWIIVPNLNHASVPRGTSLGLILDFVLCFLVGTLLISAVLRRRNPDGFVIAAFMALCGWTVYFVEVGYFGGMLGSEYPLWYELLSFIKYPLAFALSLVTRRAVP
jgi:hypothetical protein